MTDILKLKKYKKVQQLDREIKRLEEERDDCLFEFYGKELYKNCVGKYDKQNKFLIINHGCGEDSPMYTSEHAPCIEDGYYSIKGSWDWNKSYKIHKTLSCKEDYQGYIHYICIDAELQDGKEYQYKYMDIYENTWIEPEDSWMKPGTNYIDSELNQKMRRNTFGTWDACLTVKSKYSHMNY